MKVHWGLQTEHYHTSWRTIRYTYPLYTPHSRNLSFNFISILYYKHVFETIYLQLNISYLYVGFDVLCNMSFAKHLHEDGHKRWPKQVGGLECLYYNKPTYLYMHLVLFSL